MDRDTVPLVCCLAAHDRPRIARAAVATTTTSDITDYRTSHCHRSQNENGKTKRERTDCLVVDLPPTHNIWIRQGVRGIKMAEALHQFVLHTPIGSQTHWLGRSARGTPAP
jgi:hypothetical protein